MFFLQIAAFVFGIIILATGNVKLSKNRSLAGGKARMVGALLVAQLPLAFLLGLFLGLTGIYNYDSQVTVGLILFVVQLGMIIIPIIYGYTQANPVQAVAPNAYPQSYAYPPQYPQSYPGVGSQAQAAPQNYGQYPGQYQQPYQPYPSQNQGYYQAPGQNPADNNYPRQ